MDFDQGLRASLVVHVEKHWLGFQYGELPENCNTKTCQLFPLHCNKYLSGSQKKY